MKRIVIFLLLMLSISISAQQYSGISKTHKIDSKVFDAEREIRVFVPFSYTENPSQSYPIIYLFDGQFDALFDMTSGISDYMAQVGELNEFIIVGVKTEHRPSEFTPMYINEKTKEDWGENKVGEAAVLENYLKNEVFPLVETQYRVQPFRLGIGHSLGGTFVLNTLLSQPNFFQAIIAISPNLSYDYEQLVTKFDDYFKTHDSVKKMIYISVGTIGGMENNFRRSAEKLDRIIKYYNPKEIKYSFEILEDENHSTTPIYTISKGLSEVAKIWTISEEDIEKLLENDSKPFVEDIQAFYTKLSAWINYEVQPTTDEVNGFGYECLNADKIEEALKVFDWGLALYPNDANLYDSKAEAYEKKGDLKQAKTHYKKALQVLEKMKANYDSENYEYYKKIFTEHLNKLK